MSFTNQIMVVGRLINNLCKNQGILSPIAVKSSRYICRFLSSSANTTTNRHPQPQSSSYTRPPTPRIILDEDTLLSQLSPLKRIICLCPVPLGRSRVPWSGGDSFHPPNDETVDLNYQSESASASSLTQECMSQQPIKIAKYRYGERYAIGVAISDPYLTHAQPVYLGGNEDDYDEMNHQRFVAEIVPSFRCDTHNLGSSPIFHTNLPFFRNDFLQRIGHFDVGAVVLALPMEPTKNPFWEHATKVQIDQEQKLLQVRECLLDVLQNYVSIEEHDDDIEEKENPIINDIEEEEHGDRSDDDSSSSSSSSSSTITKRRCSVAQLGPLNVQGLIDHRLSITDVLSKSDHECNYGSWDNLSKPLREIHNLRTMGKGGSYLSNQQYVAHNDLSLISPEIHAAVALNAMVDKYTSGFHNGHHF